MYNKLKEVDVSRLEKHALFNLGVFVVACAFYFVAARCIGPLPAVGVFGLFGLWGVGHFFFYPKGRWRDVLDERERAIVSRSWQAGHGMFWALFVLSIMTFWMMFRGETLSISAGVAVIMVTHSITLLILSKTG
jgi:hypothetical protein